MTLGEFIEDLQKIEKDYLGSTQWPISITDEMSDRHTDNPNIVSIHWASYVEIIIPTEVDE